MPILVGYLSAALGVGSILGLALFTWLLFDRSHWWGIRWFSARRAGTLAIVVASALLLMLGVVWGADSRADEARERVRAQRAEDEARATLAEQQAAEARRRADEAVTEARREAERTRLILIETRRPPSERAAMALARLAAGDDAQARYCAARHLLAPIPQSARDAADVRPAFRALRRAERESLAAQREAYEEGRGLLCRDGQMSPTCRCHGSHRGCCSHHGGVAGCDPLPDEVFCPAP